MHLPSIYSLDSSNESIFGFLSAVRAIDETFFPNVIVIDSSNMVMPSQTYLEKVVFPRAKYVFNPFLTAYISGDMFLPDCKALGLTEATNISGHIYAPKLECLMWQDWQTDYGTNNWISRLSGVDFGNIDSLQSNNTVWLSGQWAAQLSNVRSINCRKASNVFPGLVVREVSGLHMPYVKTLSSLNIVKDVVDLQMPQLFKLDSLSF